MSKNHSLEGLGVWLANEGNICTTCGKVHADGDRIIGQGRSYLPSFCSIKCAQIGHALKLKTKAQKWADKVLALGGK